MKYIQPVKHIENRLLSENVKASLLDHIKNTVQGDEPLRLPKEEDLARQLGISRNALRDVLSTLESEGYVSRRRSKGTVVNTQILQSKCRLDLEVEMRQVIEEAGFTPDMQTIQVKFIEENDPVFGAGSASYLIMEKVFFADGEPVIHCADRIPDYVAQRGNASEAEIAKMSHFEFMHDFCNDSVSCVLADIMPEMPSAYISEILQVPPEKPILVLNDVGYNPDQQIVLHSTLSLKTGKLQYKLLRKKL